MKGALTAILSKGHRPGQVTVPFLSKGSVTIPVHDFRRVSETQAWCSVIKDAGDDPDVTHRAEIGAFVTFFRAQAGAPVIHVTGGKGVGRVTKPGLEVAPGHAAINPGPMRMIEDGVHEVLTRFGITGRVDIEIIVPEGEVLAQKTLNKRLGIEGGISILGTTGVVTAMSHDAYIAAIEAALNVAAASGRKRVVLTTGRRSERFAQTRFSQLHSDQFIQIGDFFQASLACAAALSFETVILAVFFGKAVKMAMGIPHTHAARSELCLSTLSRWVHDQTGDQLMTTRVARANTAREAFFMLHDTYPGVIPQVGLRMIQSASGFLAAPVSVQSVIFDFDGQVVYDSTEDEEEKP